MRTNGMDVPGKALVILTVLALTAGGAMAADAAPKGWLSALAAAAADEAAPAAEGPAPAAPSKPIPISFGIDYTYVSDYVWRGQNFTDWPGEEGERCNHQLNVAASIDTGGCGSINASVWLEWFNGQIAMDPASGGYCQEADYTLSWSYDIEPIGVGVEAGVIFYTFPQADGDAENTLEWFVALSLDDSKLFGTEDPVLNPTVAYYHDVDMVQGGQWIDLGISHDFELSKCGCTCPILEDITLTPSATLGISHRYWTDDTKLGNLLLGLAAGYDLGKAIGMDEKCGSLGLTAFINYSHALGVRHSIDNYDDELFGGVTIGYGW